MSEPEIEEYRKIRSWIEENKMPWGTSTVKHTCHSKVRVAEAEVQEPEQ